jgi:uncharacterized protein (TIGR00288 family)
MIPTENSNRIAVFIDFDNVEIGVKSTIGGNFDIGLVLEAIKERGEIVTKIAYSDWKRAGDYSRHLTQHAIRMVQRNLTPGGDKNGADITMALDALEMAFTHDHINVFVIVGGDSDFISLVEKLKQYGRKVIVVGGRQFTSGTMQRNCHEFIAYENLVGSSSSSGSSSGGGRGRQSERGGKPSSGGASQVTAALPLVLRALKVLSEREVTPQLGLLKSTLLQLDSTFSERNYGAGSFRDFMEKVAQTGAVELKHAGRSMLVEAVEGSAAALAAAATPVAPAVAPVDGVEAVAAVTAPVVQAPVDSEADAHDDEEKAPAATMSMQDGIRAVQHAFAHAANVRWPMYVRQARQFLRTAIEGFDERKYGFSSVVDLLRAASKENVLRIERDRQGAVRVFPGLNLMDRPRQSSMDGLPQDVESDAEPGNQALAVPVTDVVADLPIVEAQVDSFYADADDEPQPFAPEPPPEPDVDDEVEADGPQPGNEISPPAGGRRRASPSTARPARGGARATKTAKPRTPRAPSGPVGPSGAAPRVRKTAARGRGRSGE